MRQDERTDGKEAEQSVTVDGGQNDVINTEENKRGFIAWIKREQLFSTRSMSLMAIFAAMSFVLYLVVKFPLPTIFPFFLDFQISDLPALICGFVLGPIQAVIVLGVKILLKLPFSGTFFVGELADFIVGFFFIMPSAIIYRFKRTFKGALIGIILGIVGSTAAAVVANYFILVPFFIQLWCDGDINQLVGALKKLYPNITADSFYQYYLTLAVIPFNLIRGILSGGITLLVYKRLSRILKKMFAPDSKLKKAEEKTE